MFEKFKGIVQQARVALNAGIEPELRDSFLGLRQVDSGLPDRICAWVTHGEQPELLLTLQQLPADTVDWIGRIGRQAQYFWITDEEKVRVGRKCLEARKLLYQKHRLTPEQMIRLGQALEALDNRRSLDEVLLEQDLWLQYLITDLYVLSPNRDDECKHYASIYTCVYFADLLQQHGSDRIGALALLIKLIPISGWNHTQRDLLLTPEQLSPLLAEFTEQLPTLTQAWSAAQKVALCELLAGTPNLPGMTPLLAQLAIDPAKSTRQAAWLALGHAPLADCISEFIHWLSQGAPKQRIAAAAQLARLGTPEAQAALSTALGVEATPNVKRAIEDALGRTELSDSAADIHALNLPPYEPIADGRLSESTFQRLCQAFDQQFETLRERAEAEIESNRKNGSKWDWSQKSYKQWSKFKHAQLRPLFDRLNGDANPTPVPQELLCVFVVAKVMALPEASLQHFLRWTKEVEHIQAWLWSHSEFQLWMKRQDFQTLDLRAIADVFRAFEVSERQIARSCLSFQYGYYLGPQDLLPADRVWPFFLEYPQFIDEGLGANSTSWYGEGFDISATLTLIARFPSLPARWVPRLMEIALGTAKSHRIAAQDLLSQLPATRLHVIEALKSGQQEIRIQAVEWLVRMDAREAVPAIRQALDKETREVVRASLLTGLEHMGEDIGPWLAPEVLLQEARKGLKGKQPKGLAWFDWQQLPVCRWADSAQAVPPELIQWWLVLACQLKEPAGNPLLDRYLGLLDPSSRQALASVVLQAFLRQDSMQCSMAQAIEHAENNAPAEYQSYVAWGQRNNHSIDITYENVFDRLKRAKLGEYLGSAIGEKGLLAVVKFAPSQELASRIQAFMRDHYTKRAQIEALLMAIAPSTEPLILQLLLSVARRHRTNSIQLKARDLVAQIAERHQWTQAQLADRTIPSAGFDEAGQQQLSYGERHFTAHLDADLKPVLRTADGKAIKALPDARQDENAEQVKDAKSRWSDSKKELKQVLTLQTARLYEALCTTRVWPRDEWQTYLHAHPIMSRLIQRLFWLGLDEHAAVVRQFRPTEDGSLIDLDDNEVDLNGVVTVQLGHSALIDAASAQAWQQHFRDYKLKPLLTQVGRADTDRLQAMLRSARQVSSETGSALKPSSKDTGLMAVEDHVGWLSDAFTLRNQLTRLDYHRGPTEDGGFFMTYVKEFNESGVRVVIEFSGNNLPEENVVAALKTLHFERLGRSVYDYKPLALTEVPQVLLAEAYADYVQVAQACSGYEPDWQKKIPW